MWNSRQLQRAALKLLSASLELATPGTSLNDRHPTSEVRPFTADLWPLISGLRPLPTLSDGQLDTASNPDPGRYGGREMDLEMFHHKSLFCACSIEKSEFIQRKVPIAIQSLGYDRRSKFLNSSTCRWFRFHSKHSSPAVPSPSKTNGSQSGCLNSMIKQSLET